MDLGVHTHLAGVVAIGGSFLPGTLQTSSIASSNDDHTLVDAQKFSTTKNASLSLSRLGEPHKWTPPHC